MGNSCCTGTPPQPNPKSYNHRHVERRLNPGIHHPSGVESGNSAPNPLEGRPPAAPSNHTNSARGESNLQKLLQLLNLELVTSAATKNKHITPKPGSPQLSDVSKQKLLDLLYFCHAFLNSEEHHFTKPIKVIANTLLSLVPENEYIPEFKNAAEASALLVEAHQKHQSAQEKVRKTERKICKIQRNLDNLVTQKKREAQDNPDRHQDNLVTQKMIEEAQAHLAQSQKEAKTINAEYTNTVSQLQECKANSNKADSVIASPIITLLEKKQKGLKHNFAINPTIMPLIQFLDSSTANPPPELIQRVKKAHELSNLASARLENLLQNESYNFCFMEIELHRIFYFVEFLGKDGYLYTKDYTGLTSNAFILEKKNPKDAVIDYTLRLKPWAKNSSTQDLKTGSFKTVKTLALTCKWRDSTPESMSVTHDVTSSIINHWQKKDFTPDNIENMKADGFEPIEFYDPKIDGMRQIFWSKYLGDGLEHVIAASSTQMMTLATTKENSAKRWKDFVKLCVKELWQKFIELNNKCIPKDIKIENIVLLKTKDENGVELIEITFLDHSSDAYSVVTPEYIRAARDSNRTNHFKPSFLTAKTSEEQDEYHKQNAILGFYLVLLEVLNTGEKRSVRQLVNKLHVLNQFSSPIQELQFNELKKTAASLTLDELLESALKSTLSLKELSASLDELFPEEHNFFANTLTTATTTPTEQTASQPHPTPT